MREGHFATGVNNHHRHQPAAGAAAEGNEINGMFRRMP